MEKILLISLKLNFIPNTFGCYWLIWRFLLLENRCLWSQKDQKPLVESPYPSHELEFEIPGSLPKDSYWKLNLAIVTFIANIVTSAITKNYSETRHSASGRKSQYWKAVRLTSYLCYKPSTTRSFCRPARFLQPAEQRLAIITCADNLMVLSNSTNPKSS